MQKVMFSVTNPLSFPIDVCDSKKPFFPAPPVRLAYNLGTAAHTVRSSSLAYTETTSQSAEQYVEGVSSRSEESVVVLGPEASER